VARPKVRRFPLAGGVLVGVVVLGAAAFRPRRPLGQSGHGRPRRPTIRGPDRRDRLWRGATGAGTVKKAATHSTATAPSTWLGPELLRSTQPCRRRGREARPTGRRQRGLQTRRAAPPTSTAGSLKLGQPVRPKGTTRHGGTPATSTTGAQSSALAATGASKSSGSTGTDARGKASHLPAERPPRRADLTSPVSGHLPVCGGRTWPASSPTQPGSWAPCPSADLKWLLSNLPVAGARLASQQVLANPTGPA